MKKKEKKLILNRETLHPLTSMEQEKLKEILGGYYSFDVWTCTCWF